MVVDDGFIQVRVVVGATLGVIRALVLVVGTERLFGRDVDTSWSRIRHGDGSLITRNCGLLCDVVWTLTLRKAFLLPRPALPSSYFENGGIARK